MRAPSDLAPGPTLGTPTPPAPAGAAAASAFQSFSPASPRSYRAAMLLAAALLLLATACASPIKRVTDPLVPFERPGYSFLPPPGEGWAYMAQDRVGQHEISFGKKPASPTYSLVASVTESHGREAFRDPQELLTFIRQSAKLDMDPRRFTLRQERIDLDPRFGRLSVRNQFEAEDRGAVNLRGAPHLLLRQVGYVFVLPGQENILVSLMYSERGRPNELNPAFEAQADRFFQGVRLRSR